MITWDEKKRQINIKKHGIDFANCSAIFDTHMITKEDDREDTPYDPNDPDAIANFWEGANITKKGKIIGIARKYRQDELQEKTAKIEITLPLSSEVIEYFRATGKGWQSRIDEALREHVFYHSAKHVNAIKQT
jgi:uncharacterized protein (DUF4415 family)